QADQRVALAREQTARAAAEEATRRSEFLSRASNVLATSLDFDATMQGLLCVVVPYLADVAAVSIVEESDLSWQSYLAWVFPPSTPLHPARFGAEEARADELRQGVDRVLGTGKATLIEALAIPSPPGNMSAPPEHQIHSAAILPLLARGRTLGALT